MGAGAKVLPFAAQADGGEGFGGHGGNALVDFRQRVRVAEFDFQGALRAVVEFLGRESPRAEVLRGAFVFMMRAGAADVVKAWAQYNGFYPS